MKRADVIAHRRIAGYQLVPIEPTKAMWQAANKADDIAFRDGNSHGADIATIWETMLEAAKVEAK